MLYGQRAGGHLIELIQDIVNHRERGVKNINENILRNGNRVWKAWTSKYIFDQEGQLLDTLAVSSDITGRRRAEDDVRPRREWLRYRAE